MININNKQAWLLNMVALFSVVACTFKDEGSHTNLADISPLVVALSDYDDNFPLFQKESGESEQILNSEPKVLDLAEYKKRAVKSIDDKHLSKKNIDLHYKQEGYASFYGKGFHGRPTANGAIYDMYEYTAAHRDLPMPSIVKVTNLHNKRSVMVVINDRGPYHYGTKKKPRIIDLSYKAAKDLGMIGRGVAKVRVEYMQAETKALLNKFPQEKRTKANLEFQKSLIAHLTNVNTDNNSKRKWKTVV